MSSAHTVEDSPDMSNVSPSPSNRKGFRFWLVLLALIVSLFLAILESFAVSTALPVISSDLHATQFLWVASAYGLASTALLPLSGGMAEIFGRRPVMLVALVLFCIGSALGGAARNMNMLIAARTIQGAGAGGIFALSQIVLSDMVTLNLNLPLAGLSFVLVLAFVTLPSPPGNIRKKIAMIDFVGNAIIIGSTCACVIALTWGGVVFPWSSPQVLVPLCFVQVPATLVSNRTSLSGYVQIALCSFLIVNLVYYLPVYYQACKGTSPIASGIDLFGITFTTAPISIIVGASVKITKRYRPQICLGWALAMVGLGLLSMTDTNTSRGASIGYQIVTGLGIGMVYSTAYFPVRCSHSARRPALGGAVPQVWAVTIGGLILQNGLQSRLPVAFAAEFANGASIAYTLVPQVHALSQPLKDEVRRAFAESLVTIWRVLIGIAGGGLLVSLAMRGLPLHSQTDEKWALERPGEDGEKSEG
ncbi:putative transporter C3H1.06c [Grifola frondosa]|uniref:Putative transporter C3H1.06c n=1 Tax=Grifola frondosa TaxID=5627 RepID=A0A1C7MXR8_GRIFR|nr:putative transporter C3H1.06c [Grifola frondosa]